MPFRFRLCFFLGLSVLASWEGLVALAGAADLRDLSLAGAVDICPQGKASAQSQPVRVEAGWVLFAATDATGGKVEYRFRPEAGLASLEGRFHDGTWVKLGTGFQVAVTNIGPQQAFVSGAPAGLAWTGRWHNPDAKLTVTARLELSGGSLRITLDGDHGLPLNVGLPEADGSVPVAGIPYFSMFDQYDRFVRYLPKDKLFVSCLVDWTKTAGAIPVPRISYQANLAGVTPKLHDVIALTLSDSIDAVLPSIPNPVSSWRRQIAGAMVVECWTGSFAQLGGLLDTYHEYGMDDLLVLVHRWQRYGYDTRFPDFYPPSPSRGGLDTLAGVVKRATARGQRVAVHENYVDLYPASSAWDEAALMRTADGKTIAAWADSKHVATSRGLALAKARMPEIRNGLGTNACFLDVHSAQAPWFRVDYNPKVPYSAQMKGTLEFTNQLWAFARQNYQGPVVGEGCYSWIHAGHIDSVDAQDSIKGRFFVDFDLLKIRPLATNHGMGYYERWNTYGYVPDWMTQPPSYPELDDYRASQVAYLHAANLCFQYNAVIEVAAKEYYQARPLVRRLVDAKVVAIQYHDGARWLSSSQAIVVAEVAAVRRVRISYDNGVVIYVNRAAQPWTVSAALRIGPAGFAATEKDKVIACSNDPAGHWFDYYGDGATYFLDPRNSDWQADNLGGRWTQETVRVNDGTFTAVAGPLATDTAVSCVKETASAWRLRFFPAGRAGTVRVDLAGLDPAVGRVVALDRDGREVAGGGGDRIELKPGRELTIHHRDAGIYSYRLLPGIGAPGNFLQRLF